jgi:hypothetical protein
MFNDLGRSFPNRKTRKEQNIFDINFSGEGQEIRTFQVFLTLLRSRLKEFKTKAVGLNT